MASLTFSATFPSLSLPGVNIQSNKTSPTMASFVSAIKSSPVSSKSAFCNMDSLYNLQIFLDIDRKDVPLSKFKRKVLLIVNVASKCGFASTNYSELTHLYEKYKTEGFEILAFPCNQFGGQEPGSNPEIKQFACARYKAEFPIFDKVGVNGPSTAPVYQFLKSSAGGFLGGLIKWKLEKFLVDKNSKVVERYPLPTSPYQIKRTFRSSSWNECLSSVLKEEKQINTCKFVLQSSQFIHKCFLQWESEKTLFKLPEILKLFPLFILFLVSSSFFQPPIKCLPLSLFNFQ